MRVKHLPTLPQWNQGDDHWVLQKLPSWLKLPTWTAAQAAAIINDEDPENRSTDTLELLDGRCISLSTTNEVEKNYLYNFRHNKEAFMVHATAHNKDRASPADWLLFAETVVFIRPEWKQLAIDEGLLPSTKVSGAPNVVTIPVQKQQDNAILKWLRDNKYDPLKLPVPPTGKPGVKKLCSEAVLFSSPSVFKTTWDRLRSNGAIKDAE